MRNRNQTTEILFVFLYVMLGSAHAGIWDKVKPFIIPGPPPIPVKTPTPPLIPKQLQPAPLPIPTPDITALKNEALVALKVQLTYTQQFAQAVSTGRIDQAVVNEAQHAVATALDHPATEEALKPISNGVIGAMPQSMMMDDDADTELISPSNSAGSVIYFINGINTTHDEAVAIASAIGAKFGRPVRLIYNQTHGMDLDLVESAYDRTWVFAPLLPGNPQVNKATRKLARVLFSSTGPVSLISHSQGCIITRNALVIADAYHSDIKDRLAWVAAALPLKTSEVYLTPKKFTVLRNQDDPIAEAVGLQLDPNTFSNPNLDAHSFVKSYLPLIKPEQIE